MHAEEEKDPDECEEDEQAATTERQGSIDFAAMPTQELFRIAIPVFETVIERMNARSSAINASMTQLLGQQAYKPNFERRLQRPNRGAEAAVIDEKMHQAFKDKTRGVPHSVAEASPEVLKRFDFFLQEHNRVTADIDRMMNVADIVRGLSLPTMLLVNECHAEVVPVD